MIAISTELSMPRAQASPAARPCGSCGVQGRVPGASVGLGMGALLLALAGDLLGGGVPPLDGADVGVVGGPFGGQAGGVLVVAAQSPADAGGGQQGQQPGQQAGRQGDWPGDHTSPPSSSAAWAAPAGG